MTSIALEYCIDSKRILRPASTDDLGGFVSILAHPMVSKHNYRLNLAEWANRTHRVLMGENEFGACTWHYSSIVQGTQVIGYVGHFHDATSLGVECSWNLLPEFWGQSIMRHSLIALFDEWFEGGRCDFVFAEHFRSNKRCDRLLTRLGFAHWEFPLRMIWQRAWQNKSIRFIRRRCLPRDSWISLRGAKGSDTDQSIDS